MLGNLNKPGIMARTPTSTAALPTPEPPDPVGTFVEQMGVLYEKENMPRIAGRLFALLLVEDRSFSLRELADRLKVSRASVSTNTRMLADIGVITHVGRAGDRQDYYQLALNPLERLLAGIAHRMGMMEEFIQTAEASFPPERETAKCRLRDLATFYRATAASMADLAKSFAGRWSAPSPNSSDKSQ